MEKRFILASYIQAGAPGEIWYMAHPHLGSDHSKRSSGTCGRIPQHCGTVLFKTFVEDLTISNGRVVEAKTGAGSIPGDYFIMALAIPRMKPTVC